MQVGPVAQAPGVQELLRPSLLRQILRSVKTVRVVIKVVLALMCAAAGFGIGRLYEAHYWQIASAAARMGWRAKANLLEVRLRYARRAVELDDTYLMGYVLQARTWYASGRDEAPE